MEEIKEKQFVIYPHPANSEPLPDLNPKDKLIYIAIRRYMNKNTLSCFPSYATITKDTGAAANTIKKCVDNLVKEGYLTVEKEKRKIIYHFNNKKYFEPYSYDFLDLPDLTFTERAYIVASQQYMFKDESTKEGKISYSNQELSEIIHMPQSTISRLNKSLLAKGYLDDSTSKTKVFQLGKLLQGIIWTVRDHEDRLTVLEKENAEKDAKIKDLESRLNAIEQKTNTYTI